MSGVFTMIIDTTRIHEDGIGVKQSVAGVDLLLQLVDGQHDVLEHLLGEGHGPDRGCRGQLHEGGLGRQHPAEEEEEQRMVTEGNHGLQDPEYGLVVSQQIFSQRNVLLTFSLLQECLHVFIEPWFVPFGHMVDLCSLHNIMS